MNRNLYLNVVASLLLLAVLGFGVAFVTSVDALRGSVDRLRSAMEKLDDSSSARRANTSTSSVGDPGAGMDSRSAAFPKPVGKLANSEFFDPNSVPGDRLVAPIGSDTKNMNRLINNDSLLSAISSDIVESLGARNFKDIDKFEPQLAESWSVSPDKLVYTIKLRKGVLWHDFKDPVSGREWKDVEVKAADFKFFVDVVKNEDVDCAPMRVYLNDVDHVEVVDDYNFKVVWAKPYFQALEVTLELEPLPRHLYHAYDGPFDGKRFNDDSERNRLVIGTGPYRFDSWDKGQRVILRKWGKYYGAAYGTMPPLDVKVFEFIQSPVTQLQALLSKSVDVMSLTPDLWINRTSTKEFGPDGFLEKIKYPGKAYNYIGYNQGMALFRDKKLRQALSHLVDREKIVKNVYFGLARSVSGPFFIDSAYYDKAIAPTAFSIEEAKAILKADGWRDSDGDGILDKNGLKLSFTVMYPGVNTSYQKMLPIIKEDMAKAGVDMKLLGLDWPLVVQRLEKKEYEACVLGWTTGLTPDPYQLWHSSQADVPASSNHIRFKNAEADKLIAEIRSCFDQARRIELCRKFHALLAEEQPYTFLFSPDSLQVINRRYRNRHVFPLGLPESILWTPKAEQMAVPGR